MATSEGTLGGAYFATRDEAERAAERQADRHGEPTELFVYDPKGRLERVRRWSPDRLVD